MKDMGFKDKLRKRLKDTIGGMAGDKLTQVTGSEKMAKIVAKTVAEKKTSKKTNFDD